MYSETAFLRDSELQIYSLHYILFISDQHLWYDGCLHWNSLKAKKIALVSEYNEPLSGSYSEYETSPLPQDEHFEDNSSLDSI